MGIKLLLDKIDVEGIKTLEVYRREGGYRLEVLLELG